MLIFGMSLGYLYLMTVVGSFCLYMSSYSFMKAVKVIPENTPVFHTSIGLSFIPIFNFIFSILFLIASMKTYYNPEFRKHFFNFRIEETKKIEEKEYNEEK